jgi:hypothetical protein
MAGTISNPPARRFERVAEDLCDLKVTWIWAIRNFLVSSDTTLKKTLQ